MSRKGLSYVIFKSIIAFGLNTKYLTGQGYNWVAYITVYINLFAMNILVQ
jgi:hypothetical protein